MPPVSASRLAVSVHSIHFLPPIQVVTCGGFPTMRARSSFQTPCFQNDGHASGPTGKGCGSWVGAMSVGVERKEKFLAPMPPERPSP